MGFFDLERFPAVSACVVVHPPRSSRTAACLGVAATALLLSSCSKGLGLDEFQPSVAKAPKAPALPTPPKWSWWDRAQRSGRGR